MKPEKMFMFRLVTLLMLLMLVVAYAYPEERQALRPGAVIATEAAILCNDLEAAKQLADMVGPEAIEKFGQGLLKQKKCLIAGGIMQVKEMLYKGKTFNVIITHDTASQFYWVTVARVKGEET